MRRGPGEPVILPEGLRKRRQWVGWRYEAREGKQTKVPYDARTGRRASTIDPSTWSTYEQARTVKHQYDGLGFVFNLEAGIVGIDLDHVIDAKGEIAPKARRVLDELNSYTEFSPSGEGLHVFVRGRWPDTGRKHAWIEVYAHGRYFTVTERHLPGTPETIEERTAQLAAIHAREFAMPASSTRTTRISTPSPSGNALDDDALLARALRNQKFGRLWRGDLAAHGHDESRADLALCSHLAFWTGRRPDQMDRLFRRSRLMRRKWDARRGDRTYGQMTIAKAIAESRQTYTPERARRVSVIRVVVA
jgi:putative DNA primase/helicase